MLDQRLSQKQLQKLSPQQIQLMKLLQVPTSTLDQRIQEELEANPALEDASEERNEEEEYSDEPAGGEEESTEIDNEFDEETEVDDKLDNEDVSLDDYIEDYLDDDDAIASYKLQANNHSADDEEKRTPMAVESSFHEFLEEQLGLTDLDERELKIADQIIGSIDDDGYLRREVLSIVDDLAFSQNIMTDEKEVLRLLKEVQRFDPPGIGARDLRECLLVQLQRKLEAMDADGTNAHRVAIELAVRLLRDHFEEFSKKHFEKIQRLLSINEEQLKDAIEVIVKLNPKPASGYAPSGKNNSGRTQYIIPDFIISNNGVGELELSLNSRNAPELRVSDQYKEMLRSYAESTTKGKKEKEAVMFIKQKIDSAKWFIDAIRQRQNTMHNTMYAIMQVQRDYFLTGDEKRIRPMILKDIADITHLDISTISRVANSKYVQTEFGTRRLKDFFADSITMEDGEEVSTVEVRNILQELIGGESKRKPISDEKLKDLLMEKGYNIARRTVAKYREQLGIPVARLRKEL